MLVVVEAWTSMCDPTRLILASILTLSLLAQSINQSNKQVQHSFYYRMKKIKSRQEREKAVLPVQVCCCCLLRTPLQHAKSQRRFFRDVTRSKIVDVDDARTR